MTFGFRSDSMRIPEQRKKASREGKQASKQASSTELANARSSEIYGSDVHHPSVSIARAATGGDQK